MTIRKGSQAKIKNTDPLDDPNFMASSNVIAVKCFVTHLRIVVSLHVVNKRNLILGIGVMIAQISSQKRVTVRKKKSRKKQEGDVQAPVKKVNYKKREAVVSKSIPSDSEDEVDEVRSSWSSSEGKSSDEVFPKAVRGQIRCIMQSTVTTCLDQAMNWKRLSSF